VLVVANKQDVQDALPVNVVTKQMKMDELQQLYRVQPAIATSGEGLEEGLDWLVTQIKKVEKNKTAVA